jgi:predicted ATP-dependent protease
VLIQRGNINVFEKKSDTLKETILIAATKAEFLESRNCNNQNRSKLLRFLCEELKI